MVKQNHELGILLSVAGYSIWVVSDAFIKLAGASLSLPQILLISNFVGIAFLVGLAYFDGGIKQVSGTNPILCFSFGALNLFACWGSVAGVINLSLADFYTIVFTSPLIMTVFGNWFLKEKADRPVWIATLFGFSGVIIAVHFSQTSGHELSWFGVLATCVVALTMSLSMILVRARPGENNYALNFWSRSMGLLIFSLFNIFAPAHVASTDVFASWNPNGIMWAGLAGICGGLGSIWTNISLRLAPIAVVSPYHYTQIIGGAILGYLIWHNLPAPSVTVGALMISSSGLYISHHQRKSTRTMLADSEALNPPSVGIVPAETSISID